MIPHRSCLSTAFFLVLIFSSIALGADDYPPDIQKIISRNKLIVALHKEDQAPFFKVDRNGDLQGFDIELAKGIAQELGVDVEFNRDAASFNETVDIVLRKDADIVISKLSATLSRSKKVFFTI